MSNVVPSSRLRFWIRVAFAAFLVAINAGILAALLYCQYHAAAGTPPVTFWPIAIDLLGNAVFFEGLLALGLLPMLISALRD